MDFVPISSNTIKPTCSQLDADADGLPSIKRSMMNMAVLPYHAPAVIFLLGRKAGHAFAVCFTIKNVSPSGAILVK